MERLVMVNTPDPKSRWFSFSGQRHKPAVGWTTFRTIGVGCGLVSGLTVMSGMLQPALAEENVDENVVAVSPRQTPTLHEIETRLMDVNQIPQVPEAKNLVVNESDTSALVTDESLSAFRVTTPSLWWQERQTGAWIGTSRLVNSWAAYDQIGGQTGASLSHIDLNINGQIWNLLNYLEQYAMIHQFGQTAKSFGYQLRIFNGNTLTGGYICNFSEITDQSFTAESTLNYDVFETVPCRVSLDYLGRGGIRGSSITP